MDVLRSLTRVKLCIHKPLCVGSVRCGSPLSVLARRTCLMRVRAIFLVVYTAAAAAAAAAAAKKYRA